MNDTTRPLVSCPFTVSRSLDLTWFCLSDPAAPLRLYVSAPRHAVLAYRHRYHRLVIHHRHSSYCLSPIGQDFLPFPLTLTHSPAR